eukprot:412155_1
MGQEVSKPATIDADHTTKAITSKRDSRRLVVSRIVREIEQKYELINIPNGIQQIIYNFCANLDDIQYVALTDFDIKTSHPVLKIVVSGSNRLNGSVGKTALMTRFVDDTFKDSYMMTIGVDFRMKYISMNNEFIKVQIWDITRGRERFARITPMYFRGAQG